MQRRVRHGGNNDSGAEGKRCAQLDTSATGGAFDRPLPPRLRLRLRRAGLTSDVSVPAALLASGGATLIGRPTGGSRQGLNGGQLCWVTLPNSGVGVDVPLLARFFHDQPDTGVLPDVAVPLRCADIATGIDADVRAAHAHLARNP